MSTTLVAAVIYEEASEEDKESGVSFVAYVYVSDGEAQRLVTMVPVLGGPLSDARRGKISEALVNLVGLIFDGDDEGPVAFTPMSFGKGGAPS